MFGLQNFSPPLTLSDSQDIQFLLVYEIYPASPEPAFQLVGTLELSPEQGIHHPYLSGTMLAFIDDGDIILWDFKENTSISWRAAHHYNGVSLTSSINPVLDRFSHTPFTAPDRREAYLRVRRPYLPRTSPGF